MSRLIVMGLVALMLTLGLGGVAYASYGGIGAVGVAGASARSGSLHGPSVLGGGPGHGK